MKPVELDRRGYIPTDATRHTEAEAFEELRQRGFVLSHIEYPPEVVKPCFVFVKYERTVQNLGDAELKRISDKVRKAVIAKFGSTRGSLFFMNNVEPVAEVFRATWKAIREELEMTGGR